MATSMPRQEWHSQYCKSDFLRVLKKHWKEFVLVAFQSYDDPAHEERLANKFLLYPLEYFMCNGDPEVGFRQLKEVDQPSQLCGQAIKTGEPTFSCRECAIDPTCVMCMDCFHASVHKKHRYRMSHSGGGAFCDCGDPEAWKSDFFCENHKPETVTQNVLNSMEKLPNDLANRSSAVLLACLRYAVEMLTWDKCDSLPANLTPEGELSDKYLCMLFNDEIHTYAQVISTLQTAMDCTRKAASDYATTVDRVGRAAVKYGTYTECERVKNQVESNSSRHGSQALKVQVMHRAVVAHQQFALRLIQWLQNIIGQSDGLRQLFCMLSMQPQTNGQSLMEMLLLADTHLWKIARVKSHQLMMAGVLMDQECKTRFSILFTKNYNSLMKNFCLDDHHHDVSIASLSVQIFTVTSLSRLLVSEHNLLSVILQTFETACGENMKDGKLSFERTNNSAFQRACVLLHDLQYALICKPSSAEWTDQLRSSFLDGYTYFLELLKLIEGMEAVKRQTEQHLEFASAWEGAFNLQLQLEKNIALFLNWCASDREVLIQSFNKTVEAFNSCKNLDAVGKVSCSVAGHKAECLNYDVESQPISIHLPITRILAGLHTYLGDHALWFESTDCHLMRPAATDLLEFPLRIQVMEAQSHANMWRRNGYTLVNQIFYYHNLKFRREMYDRDVVMLQIAASMMDNNEFLLQLIHKYKLTNWTREDFDRQSSQMFKDSLRQTELLAEEFLNLLIVIVGERFIAGVGEVSEQDIVRREIIHQLCISPLAHSELAQALPQYTNHEADLDNIVEDVAIFKKMSPVTGKGRYELKHEFYACYNPYFYHYTKGDKSKSEEIQVKRRKENKEDQALPPPVPPKFRPMFIPVMGLLQCDIMIYVLELVLYRATEVKQRTLSEAQVERVLHLIGVGLHEQKRAIEEGNTQFDFLTRICKPSNLDSKSTKDPGRCIETLLEKILSSNSITHDNIRYLLIWTVKTITEVRKLKNEPAPVEKENAMFTHTEVKAEAVRRKKQAAAERRQMKIMAQMSAMQKNFIKENTELFENTSTELPTRIVTDMDISEAGGSSFPVAVGCNQTCPGVATPQLATCILCKEEQEITLKSKAIVLPAFVQKSTVLSLNHGNALFHGEIFDPLFMRSDLPTGSHTSSCGHTMHVGCWQSFFDNILVRELWFRHNSNHDIEKMEFLCPLCESISNTVTPVLPSGSTLGQECSVDKLQLSFADWLDGIHKTVLNSIQQPDNMDSIINTGEDVMYQPCPLVNITRLMPDSVAQNFQALWTYTSDESSDVSLETKEMLLKFARDAYSFGLGVEVDDKNQRVIIMLWNTCAFSIMAIEQQLRDDGKPLFGQLSSRQSDCLRSIVKVASMYSQIVNPEHSKQHCLRLLTFLFPDSVKGKANEPPMSILDVDLFHYLVAVVMSLPSLHTDLTKVPYIGSMPPGSINHQHALQLILAVHLIQVLLTFDKEKYGMDIDGEYEGEALLILYNHINTLARVCQNNTTLPRQLSLHVRRSMLPFLRCVALLFHYWTDIPSPAELSGDGGEMKEFDAVCKYLGVNHNMSLLLENQGVILDSIVNRLCKNSQLNDRISAVSQPVVQYPLRINKLIELPCDYSELINRVSTFTCPKSNGDASLVPTMCLVCGKILCSQNYCCRTECEGVTVGPATEHALKCGAGTGIFLIVRDCRILLLAGRTKGCFLPSPYIDDYGETDEGFRRGNPLHLCKNSYAYLQKLWMSHAIPEAIAHNLEPNATLLTINWQHM